jgi:sec-independent protein translocase protein TatB
MFGLSFGEIVIIAILALVLLGPDRLPEALKTGGKMLRDLKKSTDGLKDQIEKEMYSVEKSVNRMIDAPDVPPVAQQAMSATVRPVAPAPAASLENVPGLDAALIETMGAPAPAPQPAAPAPAEPATPARPA